MGLRRSSFVNSGGCQSHAPRVAGILRRIQRGSLRWASPICPYRFMWRPEGPLTLLGHIHPVLGHHHRASQRTPPERYPLLGTLALPIACRAAAVTVMPSSPNARSATSKAPAKPRSRIARSRVPIKLLGQVASMARRSARTARIFCASAVPWVRRAPRRANPHVALDGTLAMVSVHR
jgi:hypothetical protein